MRLSKFNFGNSNLDSIDLWLWRGVVDFNPGISQQAKAPPFLSREPDVVNRDNEPTSRTRYKRFVPPVLPALSASQSPRAATSQAQCCLLCAQDYDCQAAVFYQSSCFFKTPFDVTLPVASPGRVACRCCWTMPGAISIGAGWRRQPR